MRTARWFPGPFALLALLGCARDEPPPPGGKPEDAVKVVLVVHGGAGVLTLEEMAAVRRDDGSPVKREDFEAALVRALKAGYAALQGKSGTSTGAVEAAIRVLEDDELFNAGRGAALDEDGRASLDASIMEGRITTGKEKGEGKKDAGKRAGAVAAVLHIKNPISAARAVMEMQDSRHVLLVGEGAEAFALGEEIRKAYDIKQVANTYFWTNRRLKQLPREPGKPGQTRAGGADLRMGTVGAVARDKQGSLTAGTSTGGLTNKMRGRLGDSPLIGAGTYADDRACGVSCTGTGEVFIRHAVAHDVVARMLYRKSAVLEAVRDTIAELPDEPEGVGGLIALDRHGRVAFGMSPRSVGMYRGFVTEDGEIHIAIYSSDKLKKTGRIDKR